MASFKVFIITICILGFCPVGTVGRTTQKSWHEGPDTGWSWYKDPKKLPKPQGLRPPGLRSHPQNSKDKSQPQEQMPHSKRLQKVRDRFDDVLAKAVLSPTLENVQEAQSLYNEVINKATEFEKAWVLASLLSAQGYRASDQTSPLHRQIYQEKEDMRLEKEIASLARVYGIFFLVQSDCRYCHSLVPTIKQISQQYGFKVKVISSQGQEFEGFEDVAQDNGAIAKLNPEGIFPTVLLINPHTAQAIPLARGLLSPSEIKANFKVIIQYLKEQNHDAR